MTEFGQDREGSRWASRRQAGGDRGLDQASLNTKSHLFPWTEIFLFFRLGVAPGWSSPGRGGVGSAPYGCAVIFGMQGRNVACLSVCLTQDLDPQTLMCLIGGSRDHGCFQAGCPVWRAGWNRPSAPHTAVTAGRRPLAGRGEGDPL